MHGCPGAEQGRFPQLSDRHNLRQLLVKITVRKEADLVRYERRCKRGGAMEQEGVFPGPCRRSAAAFLASV